MNPYKLFTDDTVDQKAVHQFFEAMSQDFVVQGALMPDAHCGYSLPIGGVVETKGVVVPAWVGYDQGCGLSGVKIQGITPDQIRLFNQEIMDRIIETVPMGFSHHKGVPDNKRPLFEGTILFENIINGGGIKQLGTLGGGNHFIELGYDEDDMAWVIVHSGSRGVGHMVATEYMKIASGSTSPKEGHFGLDIHSPEGQAYLKDHRACVEFAHSNRTHILNRVLDVLKGITAKTWTTPVFISNMHNEALVIGDRVIHRKGATNASKGTLGIIPGNLKEGSFIVEGKGNLESINSCSHGAGRVHGRKEAKRLFTIEDFETEMMGTEVLCNITQNNIDESPMAYKDIYKVLELQKDLLEVKHHIKPLINIKS
jgi:tRNA-splicing ligase RtcB